MSWPKSQLTLIATLAAGLAVLQPAYLIAEHSRGRAPLALADTLYWYAPIVAIVLWIMADAKERRRTPCFDYGFFLLLLWPISLFWYCIGSRGWRELGLAIGLLLLSWAPAIMTAAVAIVWAIANAVLYG